MIAGVLWIAFLSPWWLVVLVVLLPWRIGRIKTCNHFGSATGAGIARVSSCPLTIVGREEHGRQPGIYVSNHTSVFDIFLGMWLSPTGTVGVGKRSVVLYPFIGQLYLLSGHLLIDRSNPERAHASLARLSQYVRDHGLSIFIWPEGTRSRDGRLGRFRKGFAHLALQTGLPVVPMVVTGAYKAWPKGTLSVRVVPLRVEFLEPIETSGWSRDTLDEHIAEVKARFAAALPEDQQPVEAS